MEDKTHKRVGRPKGSRNKVTAEIKELAQEYGPEALATLAGIMRDAAAPHQARVAASNALLDRGYGKPVQANELTGANGGAVAYEFVIRRAGSEPNVD